MHRRTPTLNPAGLPSAPPAVVLISENPGIPIIQKWVLLWLMSDKMKLDFRLDLSLNFILGVG